MRGQVVLLQHSLIKVGIGNGLCAVTIDVAVEPDVPWGFGTPFLRNFCQHFDIAKQQLGLSLSL